MPLDTKTHELLQDIAHRLRLHSIDATAASNSGHPTSCSSIAEVMSTLFFHEMKYTVAEPRHQASDRFVLSKGHAAPVLYAAWAEAGLIPIPELKQLRKLDNLLEGHPTPKLSFIDVATGSLGQGLGAAVGMAYAGKYFDKADYRTYCICGDGESAEGSIWEAMAFASHYKLDNLVNIIDVNRLGQSEPTMYQHDMETYKKRAEAFGWFTQVVDGHDINALNAALEAAKAHKGQPACILAQTHKGKYFTEAIDNDPNWHGKPLGKKTEEVVAHVRELIVNKTETKLAAELLPIKKPTSEVAKTDISNIKLHTQPDYKIGEEIATRLAYGTALTKVGKANDRVIALDADVKNSTFSIKFKNEFPDRFVECFIAEQNLASVAIGAACRDRTVAFASTFAAFWSRAFDQIRMGAISHSNVNFTGSHVGCSIGEDGASQMALEDLSMFRSVANSTVFYPSDAVSTERAVELAANTKGICYIRTSRPATAVIYANDHVFKVGKANVVVKNDTDVATIVSGGVTLHEAIKAAATLKEQGINVRVIDVFTVKPLDWETILANVLETKGQVLTVEDHYPQGGISEAVATALLEHGAGKQFSFRKLNVNRIPISGQPKELMARFEIDADAIVKAVKSF
jgi:transketolase